MKVQLYVDIVYQVTLNVFFILTLYAFSFFSHYAY